MKLLIRVAISFPFSGTATSIEHGGQLAVRPAAIFLPDEAQSVCEKVGNRNGEKRPHAFLVGPKKLPACADFIVNNIENLAFDAGFETCQNDGFRAITDERQWQAV